MCFTPPWGFGFRLRGARKWRNQRSRIALLPAAIGFRDHRFAVGFHLLDKAAGRGRFLVTRRPQEQFKHDGGERDAFGCEPIVNAAAIFDGLFCVDDAVGLEFVEPIGKDIG